MLRLRYNVTYHLLEKKRRRGEKRARKSLYRACSFSYFFFCTVVYDKLVDGEYFYLRSLLQMALEFILSDEIKRFL